MQYGVDTSYDSSDSETDIQGSITEEVQNNNNDIDEIPSLPTQLSKQGEYANLNKL